MSPRPRLSAASTPAPAEGAGVLGVDAETPAGNAVVALLAMLADAEIEATHDAGAVNLAPIGVLVGLPELVARGLQSRTYLVAVTIISVDPLNSLQAVDRLYSVADRCAAALSTDRYRPTSFSGSPNAEPLPAIELQVTLTTQEV